MHLYVLLPDKLSCGFWRIICLGWVFWHGKAINKLGSQAGPSFHENIAIEIEGSPDIRQGSADSHQLNNNYRSQAGIRHVEAKQQAIEAVNKKVAAHEIRPKVAHQSKFKESAEKLKIPVEREIKDQT